VSVERTWYFSPIIRKITKNMKFGFSKCLAWIALVVITFTVGKTYAQARPSPATSVVSVDFVPLIYTFPITFQYEMKSDPVSSLVLRLHYWPGLTGQYTGYGVGGAYRFYVADSRALTGLAVAPAADLFFFRQAQLAGGTGSSRSAIGFDIGGDLSYKWIFDQFAVEPIFGLRFGIGGSNIPTSFTTIQPLIGVNLGYAW
jgi:hypothetical protein